MSGVYGAAAGLLDVAESVAERSTAGTMTLCSAGANVAGVDIIFATAIYNTSHSHLRVEVDGTAWAGGNQDMGGRMYGLPCRVPPGVSVSVYGIGVVGYTVR